MAFGQVTSFFSHHSGPTLLFRERQILASAALEKAAKLQGESEIPCVSQAAPSLHEHSSDYFSKKHRHDCSLLFHITWFSF